MKTSFLAVQKVMMFLIAANGASGQNPTPLPYKNAALSTTERVKDLLSRMTLEEKVAQLESAIQRKAIAGAPIDSLLNEDHLNEAVVRKTLSGGLGTIAFLDEFNGVAGDARAGAEHRNLIQSWVLKNTRLGIPVLFHGEALHGAVIRGATSFPQAVGLGSTWDPPLLEQMFTTVAIEERALGNKIILGPVLDLSRDPRFGRVEEMYSEDPFLVAQLGIAAVRGLQGDSETLGQQHVFATAKHFLHGQPENGTNGGPSDYSEHTTRSIFLYPFEEVVRHANIAFVMPSYNETMGGIPSNANPWLLKQILRKEWGFKGVVVSDYGAIEQLAAVHHIAANAAAAGLLAFRSGVDMELPAPFGFPGLVDAVRTSKISVDDLDASVEHILRAKFNAGLFEHPLLDPTRAARDIGTSEHSRLARKVADEAIVLLKNESNLLPLDPTSTRTIAVIGPNANKQRLGDYAGTPAYFVTVLDGIRKRAGVATTVVYAEGCQISDPDTSPTVNTYINYKPSSADTDHQLMEKAVEIASKSDLIVLALGGNEVVSREATGDSGAGYFIRGDTDTLELPGRQNELVERIAHLGKPVVAVLLNGRAYAIEQLSLKVPTIVEGWYLGQETGNAIAGVLFGDVNPSGHLPVTIARNVGQLPVFYYKTPNARTAGYVFDDNSPLFPFGYGLSYTTFKFSNPVLERQNIVRGEATRVSVLVTNSGNRAGDDVVQMYVHHPLSSIVQPEILLRGFERIHLDPGQSRTVTFDVGDEQISVLDANMQRTTEAGEVDLRLGDNSEKTIEVRLTVLEKEGKER